MIGRFLAVGEPLDHFSRGISWIPADLMDLNPGQRLALLLPLAYLLGSIPFGKVVGRIKGIDVTTKGSGNIGATNVGRLLGRKYFYLVFFLDMFKGMIPMLLACAWLSDAKRNENGYLEGKLYFLWMVVGFAAVGGHMFSAFLKLKGGKGIATSLGVMLGLFPFFTLPAIPVFAVWLVFFLATRYVSLASIIGASTFPIWFLVIGYWRHWPVLNEQLSLTVFAFVIAILIVIKHRGNIRRLMEGREPHYHPAKSTPSTSTN